jgi:cytochrome c peroxidase
MTFARCLIAAAAAAALSAHADPQMRADALKLFGVVEAASPAELTRAEVHLGRALFWDTRLSLDGKTACASCHMDHGADRRIASIDAKGLPTSRHSPTVFNSMGQPALRWLGDRKTGAEQAEGSITGSMGFASKQEGVAKLKDLQYEARFRAAFPDEPNPLTSVNYGRALHAYQASLSTPSPFDRFLAGDDRALTAEQKQGLKTFVATGCAGCHDGPLLGGTKFMKFGLVKDYWSETGAQKPDVGRFAMTKKDEDKYVFRVPMLRNVAKTAPYFHDGSVDTLDRAVRIMGATQLGRKLDDATVGSIVAFLESLTGEVPAHYAPPK